MANEFQKLSGDYQRTGKEAMSSMLRSAGDYRKSLQDMSFEMAELSKRSVSQAIEAQAQLTKKAFDAYISELTKFSMLGLYGPFSRDGSSEGRGAEETRDRGAATRRRKAASRRNQGNNKESKARAPAAASNGLPLNARARREKRAQQKHEKESVKLRHVRVHGNRKTSTVELSNLKIGCFRSKQVLSGPNDGPRVPVFRSMLIVSAALAPPIWCGFRPTFLGTGYAAPLLISYWIPSRRTRHEWSDISRQPIPLIGVSLGKT